MSLENLWKPLGLLALPVLLLTAGGTRHPSFERKLPKELQPEHALNRLAFGPRPGDVERVRKLGLNRWIDEQLHPAGIAVNPLLAERLAPLQTINLTTAQIAEQFPLRAGARKGKKKDVSTPVAKQPGRPGAIVGAELVEAKIYRAIYSDRQLEEVLVDFWFNHFNVYLNKGPERLMVTSYERDAIRPFVLGRFGDMLRATAKHPAMLFYLDNWQSVDPKAMAAITRRRAAGGNKQLVKRARGLNENYARELMELHTLGVDGGYTQQDVVEVARCFTGWTLRDPRRGASYLFAPMLHDQTAKTVLGHPIAAGRGEEDGLEVIDILARHPATARFISRKLAQRFVGDQPPQALVDRMAAAFTKTQGDLREVMKTMIASPEFFSEGAYRSKLKSPFEMVISAARALDAGVTSAKPLSSRIDALGQPLYRKEEPTGYHNTADEWTNTAGLVGRMNFATALAGNQLPGAQVDATRYTPPADVRLEIEKRLEGRQPTPELIAGLGIGSPEFQRR